jgi:hypothetical protein
MLDGVGDSIGQYRILVCAAFLLKVVSDAGRDRFAGHLFRAFTSKQNEREIRIVPTNSFEKFNAVLIGYIVVGDDTVERTASELGEPITDRCRCLDTKPIILSLEERCCQLRETGIILNMENTNRLISVL